MTDKIESLTTEHLRLMRDDIATLGNRIDAGFATVRKENGSSAEFVGGIWSFCRG